MHPLRFVRLLSAFAGLLLLVNSAVDAACVGTAVATATLGPASHTFHGAAIIAPNDMWLVGGVSAEGTSTATLAEHWNGSKWTVVPTPSPGLGFASNVLNSITALSTNDVWAVGQSGSTTLIEHWDGSSWTVVPSPSKGYSSKLMAVTATSPINVWAAGSYDGTLALTEVWNGVSWSIVSDTDPRALTSISATSPADVWATGQDVEHWDGSTWQVVLTQLATSVSAVAPNDVWILVGSSQIEHYDGSSWSIVPSPQVGNLSAITANAADNAWVVGSAYNSTALTEHWDGKSWTVVSSPHGGRSAGLAAVAMRGAEAIAVGSHTREPYNELEGLDEIWSGSRWTLEADVQVDLNPNTFAAAFATASNNAWAVGSLPQPPMGPVPKALGLVEHWDGTQWTFVPVTTTLHELDDVSGLSASDVWAVGVGDGSCSNQAAAVHWDGTGWDAASPDVCAIINSNLVSVSEMSPTAVWAVGSATNPGRIGSYVTHDLVLRWTGRYWITYALGDDPYNGGLAAVRGASVNDVWAVGNTVSDSTGSFSLIFHWNGASWSDMRVKNPKPGALAALAVVNANDVWAVGAQNYSRGMMQPLIDHWNGVAWRVIPNAPGSAGASLSSVSALASNDVWAIGSGPPGGAHVEHWDGRKWSIITTSVLGGDLSGVSNIPGTNSVWMVGHHLSPYFNPLALSAVFHC